MASGEISETNGIDTAVEETKEFKQFDIVTDLSEHYNANLNPSSKDQDCFINETSGIETAAEDTKQSKQFDVITDHSDHYNTNLNLSSNNQDCLINETSGVETAAEETKEFKQFDVVTDHSDHYNANLNPSSEDQDSFINETSSIDTAAEESKEFKQFDVISDNSDHYSANLDSSSKDQDSFINGTSGIDTAAEETKEFKQFDIVTDHSDHYYANLNPSSGNQDCFTNSDHYSANLDSSSKDQDGFINETSGIDTAAEETKEFKQFDIVTDHSDHYYANLNPSSENQDCFTSAGSSVRKKIMQEWNILEKGLPRGSIFVRVYEGRIDLLRAVIIGTTGTPYHDGLFFFDFAFPSDYPNQPPQVYYHSHGLRLNPNLYAKGYVCLSLLNTWHGNEEEMWSPSGSTILQVLLSLQGLVLNEEPYYNEPGYERYRDEPETQKIALDYSEQAFILSCKTMLYLLQKPPKNFEDFVAAHFHERANVILKACKAYADGQVRVGYYQDDGSSSTSALEVSTTFKQSMDKLYTDLETAFNKNRDSMQKKPEEMKQEIVGEP